MYVESSCQPLETQGAAWQLALAVHNYATHATAINLPGCHPDILTCAVASHATPCRCTRATSGLTRASTSCPRRGRCVCWQYRASSSLGPGIHYLSTHISPQGNLDSASDPGVDKMVPPTVKARFVESWHTAGIPYLVPPPFRHWKRIGTNASTQNTYRAYWSNSLSLTQE